MKQYKVIVEKHPDGYIAYPLGRSMVSKYAVTAAPLLGAVPALRLSPARFWRHRTGGLVPVVSGNEAFDVRWLLMAAEDGPQVRRLVQDPAVQGLLLGTDDGDEFWSAAGHVVGSPRCPLRCVPQAPAELGSPHRER